MAESNFQPVEENTTSAYRLNLNSLRIALLLVLLVSAGLYAAAAIQKSFWEDEAFTASVAQRDPEALQQTVAADVHPPLYLFLASQWGRIFGYNEPGLRSLSILFALCAGLVTYYLARDLFDERVAIFSIVLLSFAPLMLMFAPNARYYALSAALAALTALAFIRYHKTGKPGYLLLYTGSSIVYLYLVYSSVIILALCNLWFLIFWLQSRPRLGSRLAAWLAAQLLVGLAYLPAVAGLIQVVNRFPQSASVTNWPVELLKRLLYSGYVYSLGETLSPLNPAAWLGALTVLGIAVFSFVKNRRSPSFWLVASFVAGILIFNLVISLNEAVSLTWQNLPARNLNLLPFLAIWLAAGLARMRPRRSALLAGLLLVVYGISAWNYFAGRQYLRPIYNVPWREIFTTVRDQSTPKAGVFCSSGDYACYYYLERFGFPRLNPKNLAGQSLPYSEVWWIQTYLSRKGVSPADQAAVDRFQAFYKMTGLIPFDRQDAAIMALKNRWMGSEDYEYRVVVYHFSEPVEMK